MPSARARRTCPPKPQAKEDARDTRAGRGCAGGASERGIRRPAGPALAHSLRDSRYAVLRTFRLVEQAFQPVAHSQGRLCDHEKLT